MKYIKLSGFFIIIYFLFGTSCLPEKRRKTVADKVELYYGKEFALYADWFALSEEYLSALAAIEVSGRKDIPHRFEKHVYEKLLSVKNGELDKFENITQEDLKDLKDSTLRKMAKSWGPFQIMGYKCFYLYLSVDELIDSSSFYGAQWIDLSYGDLVRKKKFKDAFHFHNTGKMYPDSGPPLTHDPNYVKNGMRYMQIFKKRKFEQTHKDSISIRFR